MCDDDKQSHCKRSQPPLLCKDGVGTTSPRCHRRLDVYSTFVSSKKNLTDTLKKVLPQHNPDHHCIYMLIYTLVIALCYVCSPGSQPCAMTYRNIQLQLLLLLLVIAVYGCASKLHNFQPYNMNSIYSIQRISTLLYLSVRYV